MAGPKFPVAINRVNYSDHRDLFDTYNMDLSQVTAMGYARGYSFTLSGHVCGLENSEGRVPAAEANRAAPIPNTITEPATVSCVSTDPDDVAVVQLAGTDADSIYQEENVVMIGTTPSESVIEYRQITRATYLDVLHGNAGVANRGTITIGDPAGDVWKGIEIDPGAAIGFSPAWFVPDHRRALLAGLTFSVEPKGEADCIFYLGFKVPAVPHFLLTNRYLVSGGVHNVELSYPLTVDENWGFCMFVQNPGECPRDVYWTAQFAEYELEGSN